MAILFITSTRIGDAVLSTGLLAAIRERFPHERLHVACGPPAAPLFEATPDVDEVFVLRKRRGSGHWAALWRHSVVRRWRLVVDLRRSLLPWLLLAAERRSLPAAHDGEHRVAHVSRTLGLPPQAPRIRVAADHLAEADRLLGEGRPLLAVAPGANWAGKIWPAERFAELALRLTAPGAPLAGAGILVTGGPDERPAAEAVLAALAERRPIDGMGLSLPTAYAAFTRCALFVGNDSGLMHLAAATGRPTVGLFGPTDDRHYAPWGPEGLALRTPGSVDALIGRPGYDHLTTGSLMGGLTVAAVAEAIAARWPALAP